MPIASITLLTPTLSHRHHLAPQFPLTAFSSTYASSRYTTAHTARAARFFAGSPLSLYKSSTCSPVSIGQCPSGRCWYSVHVNFCPRREYGARFAIAYLIGERWLTARRKAGMLMLMMPPMKLEMDRKTEVILTANPG